MDGFQLTRQYSELVAQANLYSDHMSIPQLKSEMSAAFLNGAIWMAAKMHRNISDNAKNVKDALKELEAILEPLGSNG